MLATCHLDLDLEWSPCLHLFCYITNWYLHKYCFDANTDTDIYACFFFPVSFVISGGSVETTPGPEAILCFLSGLVQSGL